MTKRKKKTIWLSILGILIIGGFFIYKMLFPTGPIMTEVPNPIRDRATLSKNMDESSIERNPMKNVYWGDLHVHTNLSFDAYIGGTRATPNDAYRFAKGEPIEIFGKTVKIQRPLDFAAVTDHSEFLGELYSVNTHGAPAHNALLPIVFRSLGTDTTRQLRLFNMVAGRRNPRGRTHLPFFQGFETTKMAWDICLEAAENHYEPGKFTTLAAYEWTLGNSRSHLHRNIFFRDMKVPDYPISAIEIDNPEDLWVWLEKISNEGATVMAVPHNTNLSNGTAYPDTMKNGEPLDQNYVKKINKFERLVEIHQAKGNSEVNAAFWQNDEFADFENYSSDPTAETNYVRFALKKGLEHEANLGTNPYKFGIMGSTDTHNATPGNTEEDDDYLGNHTMVDFEPQQRDRRNWVLERNKKAFRVVNPGGLVAVWAEANTRGEIYDAMQRKETYATSGGRIQVRFFGGFNFEEKYDNYNALVQAGYENGVPMGSDLNGSQITSEGQSPQFIIWAAKDSESANLDRVQVIKGWYKDGQMEEKIFNVALSDGRVVSEDGTVPDNGATVNMETGEWAKDKGAIELKTVWSDPEFDPSVKAFYYLRVLELPTPRWSLWDKIRHGSEFPEDVPMVVRERAWSSPIWYTPS